MSNWFKKMMDLILDDEGENRESDRSSERKNTKRIQPKGKAVGRLEDSNRSIEPKMVHQYPQEGNFRFPVIPDEEKNRPQFNRDRRQNRPVRDTERNHSGHKTQSSENPTERKRADRPKPNGQGRSDRPKFTGVNFTPSDIPSPIYGFRERPSVFPPQHHEQENEAEEKFSTYGPGYETMKAIHEEYEDLHEVTENQQEAAENPQEDSEGLIEDIEMEYPPQSTEEESDDDEEVEDFGLQTIFELEKEEDLDSYTDTYEEQDKEVIEETAEESIEKEPDVDAARDDERESVEDVEELEESEVTEMQMDQPTEALEQPIEKQEQDTHENPETRREKRNPIASDEKKGMIPFNVMMLQRDRKPKQQENRAPERNHTQMVEQDYQYPSKNLLDEEKFETNEDDSWLQDQIDLLQSTLDNFNVKAKVIGATKGPSVTRIEVQPAPGVKVNKITNLSDDIKLSLAAKDIRMEAPIPGKNAIGIEVPNKVSQAVTLREIITHPAFHESKSPLSVALGLDISGQPVITDLQKMPHGLIAGATGSGKSVCINSLLISILYKAHPDDVRLLLIDPKMVELAPYNKLPHLVTPVITDAKEATQGLKWAVDEMERRYELFAKSGVRDMERFNKLVKEKGEPDQKLPYIVVIIDELADLMMVSPQEVEDSICRIAQKARACGIHLLLATQRPSVDVITGLIKANIPTRVAFAVSSSVDSRTIIDTNGADKLLGKGDMLFLGNGVSKPVRIQGNFVSDDEIERITDHVKKQKEPEYFFEKEELIQSTLEFDQSDELFDEACEFVLEQGAASSSSLQRRFRIGYNRAARLIDMMEAKGFVSEAMGSKPRNVLITKQEYYEQSGEGMRQT